MEKSSIKYLSLFFLAIISVFPSLAYADAGTYLMWLSAGHLLIGNAIIGIFEGIILSSVFKTKRIRSILIMILANYISMVIGVVGIGLSGAVLRDYASINNILSILVWFLIGTYLITIIIEWPFCFWIMKGYTNRPARSLKASILLQSISYAILIPLYLSVSGTSLITKARVEKPSSFLKTKNAWVYFISPDLNALCKIKADGGSKQIIKKEVMLKNEYATLFICNKDGAINLFAHWSEYDKKQNRYHNRSKTLLENLSGITAVTESCGVEHRHNSEVIDFRPQDKRDWEAYTGTWALQGLKGKNKRTGKSLWIALETPFLAWSMTKATILPEDQVVCQLGDNQIVLVDLNTSQMGLITFGKGPAVVLEE